MNLRPIYKHVLLTPCPLNADHVGNIVLWSNVESAIGLVAGSLPSLRRLIVSKIKKSSSAGESNNNVYHNSGGHNTPVGLVTFGGTGAVANHKGGGSTRKKTGSSFRNPTDVGHTVATVHASGDGDWRRLHDDSSDKESLRGIRADYTYEVELTQSPTLHSPLGPPKSRQ